MQANEITFGVEIETTLPQSDNTSVGGYHCGIPVPYLDGWKAETDSSIRTVGPRHGVEFVSGILKGEEGLANVRETCEKLNERGAKVNHSCGVHITVGFDGDAKALARLIHIVANHEKALFAITGTKSRENGSWAKPVKGYGSVEQCKQTADMDRYHMLNLTHMARGRRLVEFRLFSGSTNTEKITAWIQVVLGLVQWAMNGKRCVAWNAKADLTATDKPGRTEVDRLLYNLGWTRGTRVIGLVDDDPRPLVRTLRAMADKYDTAG